MNEADRMPAPLWVVPRRMLAWAPVVWVGYGLLAFVEGSQRNIPFVSGAGSSPDTVGNRISNGFEHLLVALVADSVVTVPVGLGAGLVHGLIVVWRRKGS